jgi:hypothetical protein
MLNLSDSELDKLSREAAENFEPAENVQSWNKLGQLLDKNLGMPAPVPRQWSPGRALIYCGTVLLAIAFTYFLTKSNKNNQTSTQNLALKNRQQTDKGAIADSTVRRMVNSNHQKQSKGAVVVKNEKELGANSLRLPNQLSTKEKDDLSKKGPDDFGQQNKSGKNSNSLSQIKTGHSTAEGIKNFPTSAPVDKQSNDHPANGNRSSSLGRKSDVDIISKGKLADNEAAGNSSRTGSLQKSGSGHRRGMAANTPESLKNDSENKNAENTQAKIPATKNESEILDRDVQKWSAIAEIDRPQRQSVQISDSALRNFNNKTPISNLIGTRNPNRVAFVDRSLEIGFSFAPEFSKVKYIYNNNRVGNSFGITLGYQLFSKFSINTGVLFSQKYFQANQKQFHGPADAAGNLLKIEFVNASASVIDIPLNLRYNYFSDGNSTFFVNGGLSSYLMKKQNFTYYCTYNNGPLQYTGWIRPQPTNPPEKDYLFSMINLSTGFQTAISHSFSFQFEPYMKIPVREIGFGKVDLSSYGINISLKYAPVLKRGRR